MSRRGIPAGRRWDQGVSERVTVNKTATGGTREAGIGTAVIIVCLGPFSVMCAG